MPQDKIVIRGAREHNLKDIDVEIPRDKLVVITGISGSGKSSLAFDTIYAEGQRRYVESLSAYARQFLGQMDKPDVDYIEGLSPAISIDQKGASRNPRSTVGTVTEIYDYLRLLYARVGIPHCPQCGREISQQTVEQIVDAILELPDGSRIMIMAPLIKDRKGEHRKVLEDIRKVGYVRVRVDGQVRDVDEDVVLDRYKMHTIEAVVDRLIVGKGTGEEDRSRVADSVETALKLGGGIVLVSDVTGKEPQDMMFSEHFACVHCGVSLPEIEPRTFSFNSPHGACPACTGLGTKMEFDPELILPNLDLTLAEGAIRPWMRESSQNYYTQLLKAVGEHYDIPLDVSVRELTPDQLDTVLYGGRKDEKILLQYRNQHGRERVYETTYEGVIPNLERRYKETTSDYWRGEIERYMATRPCPACEGRRLKPESLAITVADKRIDQVVAMSVSELLNWVEALQGIKEAGGGEGAEGAEGATPHGPVSSIRPFSSPLTERQQTIARQILKEIHARLTFMVNVGLDYLTIDRTANTLSGGEAQRIRLATQIGSQLMGVLYILDEPSIGLHQRDNGRLLRTLKEMRDLGNTVLVVEHDEGTIRSADHIIDLGPGAGEHGGQVVVAGTIEEIMACPQSVTGQFLKRERQVPVPDHRRDGNGKAILVKGAAVNNLKEIDVQFPLGKFICVTGVSGSGKSSLVIEVLYKRLAQALHRAKGKPGRHEDILSIDLLDKVIDIDQSPIGRTPRSNPARTLIHIISRAPVLSATRRRLSAWIIARTSPLGSEVSLSPPSASLC